MQFFIRVLCLPLYHSTIAPCPCTIRLLLGLNDPYDFTASLHKGVTLYCLRIIAVDLIVSAGLSPPLKAWQGKLIFIRFRN